MEIFTVRTIQSRNPVDGGQIELDLCFCPFLLACLYALDATHFLLELANRHWLATATLVQNRAHTISCSSKYGPYGRVETYTPPARTLLHNPQPLYGGVLLYYRVSQRRSSVQGTIRRRALPRNLLLSPFLSLSLARGKTLLGLLTGKDIYFPLRRFDDLLDLLSLSVDDYLPHLARSLSFCSL